MTVIKGNWVDKMKARNTVLVIVLAWCVGMLAVETLGGMSLFLIPVFVGTSLLGGAIVLAVQMREDELNERLAHWYARQAVRVMYQVRRNALERGK